MIDTVCDKSRLMGWKSTSNASLNIMICRLPISISGVGLLVVATALRLCSCRGVTGLDLCLQVVETL